jgi:hypothetical protein
MTELRLPSRAGWALYRFTAFLAGVALKKQLQKQKNHLPGKFLAVGAWATALTTCYILQAPEDTHAPHVQHVQIEARFWEEKFIRPFINVRSTACQLFLQVTGVLMPPPGSLST